MNKTVNLAKGFLQTLFFLVFFFPFGSFVASADIKAPTGISNIWNLKTEYERIKSELAKNYPTVDFVYLDSVAYYYDAPGYLALLEELHSIGEPTKFIVAHQFGTGDEDPDSTPFSIVWIGLIDGHCRFYVAGEKSLKKQTNCTFPETGLWAGKQFPERGPEENSFQFWGDLSFVYRSDVSGAKRQISFRNLELEKIKSVSQFVDYLNNFH